MKKLVQLGFSLALATVLFTGCGIKTTEYNVSSKNVSKLRNYEGAKIGVDKFTAANKDENHIMCRLADTITTPKGENFEEYIQEAFISELQMANIYDNKSTLRVTGHLEKVYGSSMLGNAFWQISITISSNNGKSIKVDTTRDYPSSYLASSACNNMATSFAPTIRQLIADIINHKDFKTLIE